MSKLTNVWVFAEKADLQAELCAGAAQLGEKVTLLLAGDKNIAANADVVYYLGDLSDTKIIENYIPTIVGLILGEKPDLVLVGSTKKGRLVAAAIAAEVGTSVLSDVIEIVVSDTVESKRMVYGGAAFRTEKAKGVVIASVGVGVYESGQQKPAGQIIDVPFITPNVTIKCLEKREKVGEKVNLAAAKRLICVGRGFAEQGQLKLADDLAIVIGAEIGCTRPIAEGNGWMAKERYVGVSGLMLKPDIYVGVGISGQVQHMIGVNQARIIIAVNKDKQAPIFKQADYGIVGDLVKILPVLTEKFKK